MGTLVRKCHPEPPEAVVSQMYLKQSHILSKNTECCSCACMSPFFIPARSTFGTFQLTSPNTSAGYLCRALDWSWWSSRMAIVIMRWALLGLFYRIFKKDSCTKCLHHLRNIYLEESFRQEDMPFDLCLVLLRRCFIRCIVDVTCVPERLAKKLSSYCSSSVTN
ncbi:hypothetical protein AVEN_65383-1 [Araneus ventricosus]|uniref:Uncharacterized protein n=1 Tax=Araneus ventricosus TaxID=182803 RepID=A0A4Y2WUU9_ARAVE|nr:hypothetical protein AVEN_65383-1 [Araneus ventricosus]